MSQLVMERLRIDEQSYLFLSAKLYEISGIDLGEHKQTLVETRLGRRLQVHSCQSYEQYCVLLKHDDEEMKQFVMAMTTNKTDWFREPVHFEFLRNFLDQNKPNTDSPLLIWSAASSSGEEAYSLALTLEENGWAGAYRILGTDINEKMIQLCQSGVYKEHPLKEQVNPMLLQRWFERGQRQGQMSYRIATQIREACKFRTFNLQSSELKAEVKFDIIFLRNVLIYFDAATTEKVIQRLTHYLKPGGYFIVGLSESLNGIKHSMKSQGSSIFRKL